MVSVGPEMTVIAAEETIGADVGVVFEFLADLRNHWLLTGRWVRMLHLTGPDLGPTGGWVELRGPLGITRLLRTTVVERMEPSRIAGVAELGARTRARVTWELKPLARGRTQVRLEARLEAATFAHKLLLRLGAQG